MRYLISFLLLLLLPFGASAASAYSYMVHVSPPFGKVVINDYIECPADHSEKCLVSDQAVDSVMVVKGSLKGHVCYLTIQQDGSVAVDESRSVFCTIWTKNATADAYGDIYLQKHF